MNLNVRSWSGKVEVYRVDKQSTVLLEFNPRSSIPTWHTRDQNEREAAYEKLAEYYADRNQNVDLSAVAEQL